MIVRVDGDYSHIECDVRGCGRRSPPAAVMLEHNGLVGCGWYVDHRGSHRCPIHFNTPVPARPLRERTTARQKIVDRKFNRA